jgi:hypothetical protein
MHLPLGLTGGCMRVPGGSRSGFRLPLMGGIPHWPDHGFCVDSIIEGRTLAKADTPHRGPENSTGASDGQRSHPRRMRRR